MSNPEVSIKAGTARALDEDTIEAVRRRIGIPVNRSIRQHNEVSSTDSFRHFAEGYGDDNPLYCNPDYAGCSRWGTSISPPLYPVSAGVMPRVEWSPAQKAEMAGGDPLARIGQYMCGERWIFFKPVRAGDVLVRSQSLHAADLKPSRFGGGVGALVSHRVGWADSSENAFALRFLDFWHADRVKSRKAGTYREVPDPSYTGDDLARFAALYDAETVRGSTPRFIDDVKVGDTLGPIVKGPMAVSDIVAWHTGLGMGEYGVGAFKVGHKNSVRVPAFYQMNEYGFPEAAQRAHWNKDWAQQLGHPRPYDYGFMRTNWMVNLVTNWMGDDAWIWTLSSSVRRFNYIADVHEVSGVVVAVDPTANTVTIEVTEVNQRGETTTDGSIVVILPDKSGGTAKLPGSSLEDLPAAVAP